MTSMLPTLILAFYLCYSANFALCSPLLNYKQQTLNSNGNAVPCPMFGCTPDGRFSFEMDKFPTSNVGIQWVRPEVNRTSQTEIFGCVGNHDYLICRSDETESSGYISIHPANGSTRWIDEYLHSPPLPLMSIFGSVIGCDGQRLVMFQADGDVLPPVIVLDPSLKPIYSLNIADDDIFMIASKKGRLVTYLTNGIVMASIWLNGTIDNVNGTFVPIATPVVLGHRVYILTQFIHENSQANLDGIYQLYAIDQIRSSQERMHIAWSMRLKVARQMNYLNSNKNKLANNLPDPAVLAHNGTIFIAFPVSESTQQSLSPKEFIAHNTSQFFVIKDLGNSSKLFNSYFTNIKNLAMLVHQSRSDLNDFVILKDDYLRYSSSSRQTSMVADLWGSADYNMLYRISADTGDILSSLNLADPFATTVEITSKLMMTSADVNSPLIVIGINVESRTVALTKLCQKFKISNEGHSYVLAINTSALANDNIDQSNSLLWLVPVPNNGLVTGQIIGYSLSQQTSNKFQSYQKFDISEKVSNFIVAKSVTQNKETIFAIG